MQPLVELYQVWKELASSLQALPLEGEAREKGNVVTSNITGAKDTVSEVFLTITGAEDTVSEVFLAGIIGIVQLQTPV